MSQVGRATAASETAAPGGVSSGTRPGNRAPGQSRPRPGARDLLHRAAREWRMYVLVVPGLRYFVLFRYIPFLGNVVAFQDYSPFLGFMHSPWVGVQNFTELFSDPEAVTALKNTVVISFLQIVFAFPAPIALALLLNSIMSERVKRFVQSVVYIPHFLSWVVVVSLWQAILGGDGLFNTILRSGGLGSVDILTNPSLFKAVITSQVIWKEVGWGTIIFLAAITMIDQQLYESAAVDGAGPMSRLRHVTLPGMAPVVVLLLILRLGGVLSVGFEQILLQQPAVGADAAQVLDTFVYFHGVAGGEWGTAAAAGLVQGVVGTFLVIAANRFAKRMGSEGAF